MTTKTGICEAKCTRANFLWQAFCDKDICPCIESKYFVENSLAYAPEITMDSKDKIEEATANL